MCKSPSPGSDPSVALQRIAWIRNASGKSLALAQNRAGECGFNYPVIGDQWSGYFFSGPDYCIEARRGDDVVWTGFMSNNQGQATSKHQGTMQIKAVGWLELLTVRELHEDVTYGATNPATNLPWTDAEIVYDLLDRVIGYDTAHAPPIRRGVAYGQRYNRQKKWTRGTKIEQCFRELIELESGINIDVDPVTRQLNIYSWDYYFDHPQIVFGYNKPPFNIESFSWQVDHMAIRNRMPVYGAPGTTPALGYDPISQDDFGLFEETINITDAKENSTLLYYANAEVAVRSRPVMHYSFVPKTLSETAPAPLIDFKLGDRMRMSVDYGPIQELVRPIRCYGLGMNIDNIEKITSFATQVSG